MENKKFGLSKMNFILMAVAMLLIMRVQCQEK